MFPPNYMIVLQFESSSFLHNRGVFGNMGFILNSNQIPNSIEQGTVLNIVEVAIEVLDVQGNVMGMDYGGR